MNLDSKVCSTSCPPTCPPACTGSTTMVVDSQPVGFLGQPLGFPGQSAVFPNNQTVGFLGQPTGFLGQPVQDSRNTLSVRLNPTKVPAKFTRYRHPSHHHRLFMLTGIVNHHCDNKNCQKQIGSRDTIFSCFRCDFDLCDACFQMQTCETEVPLAQDDATVDDTTVTPLSDLLCVRII
jgi:hypothetical protein